MRVSILGAGRVGGALARSLPDEIYNVENLIYRGTKPDFQVGKSGRSPAIVSPVEAGQISSDVIFITTQDHEIAGAALGLVEKCRDDATVFHTSGSLNSTVLGVLRDKGCSTGSIHPLVSISDPKFGRDRFQGVYICVEGDARAAAVGRKIVHDLGGRAFGIATEYKTLYHAAAVTACGHLVALVDASIEMMTKCGLDESEAQDILMPLVVSTVENLGRQNTAAALTGTFARADIETFTRQVTTLDANVSEQLMEIYLVLAERSLELASRQGGSARMDKLRTKVAIAKSKLKW